MKKLSLLAILAISLGAASAQDIKEIKNMTLVGQNVKAKEAVDKYLAVEKNASKPEGWYYKGYIYDMVSKDSSKTMDESRALKAESYAALQKYRTLDPKAPLLQEQNNSVLFDLYVGYSSELGVKAYSAKNIEAANNDFVKALEIHDYIFNNNLEGSGGFKFSKLDTTLLLYTAITASELKKPEEAAKYYKMLTDASISDTNYIDAYQFLADHYRTTKNKEGFADIIAKGKKFYPKNNEYWTAMEIEEATDGVAKPGLFDKYEELLTKYPDNYTLPYNYGVELYQYIYSDEMKTANTSAYKTKLPELMKKALAIKSTSEANFLLANFLYNNSIDISEEARKLRGPKPEDLKKRKLLEAEATKSMNDAIPYAEAVNTIFLTIPKPKGSEKVNNKQAFTILKNIYEIKKDAAKVAEYDQKIKAAM